MILLYFLCLCLLAGCHAGTDRAAEHTPMEAAEPAPEVQLTASAQVVVDFYTWYLEDYYNGPNQLHEPYPALTDSGFYQLDTGRYQQILRATGYFSAGYFAREAALYAQCNRQLREVDTARVNACGCNPAEFTDDCTFTFYLIWLFHQGEQTQGLRVVSAHEEADTAQVTVCLFENASNPDFCVAEVSVSLVREGGTWRIDEIGSGG